jgi:hypothetical protein
MEESTYRTSLVFIFLYLCLPEPRNRSPAITYVSHLVRHTIHVIDVQEVSQSIDLSYFAWLRLSTTMRCAQQDKITPSSHMWGKGGDYNKKRRPLDHELAGALWAGVDS